MVRYIWVIRHAKSSWETSNNSSGQDIDRPLNKRGKSNGDLMMNWLARQPNPATWIWSSVANRAQLTAAFVQRAFEVPHVVVEPRLYLASAETLLSVLRTTPDNEISAAIVAHNPGMTHLVNLLGAAHVTSNLPTFGTARFTFDGDWPDLRFGGTELQMLTSPKTLPAD